MNIGEQLSQKINLPQIKSVVSWASGSRENLAMLWCFARSDDRRTSVNAIWVMTHLQETDAEWLLSLRDEMIDILLRDRHGQETYASSAPERTGI